MTTKNLNKIPKSLKTYKQLFNYSNKKNPKLVDDDFIYSIEINMEDGSKFYIPKSYIEINKNYIIVFPSLFTPLIFNKEGISYMEIWNIITQMEYYHNYKI